MELGSKAQDSAENLAKRKADMLEQLYTHWDDSVRKEEAIETVE